MRRQQLEPTHQLLEPLRQGEGGGGGDDCRRVDDNENNVMARGDDVGRRRWPTPPPPPRGRGRRRHVIVVKQHRSFRRFDLQNKDRASSNPYLPFAGPDNVNLSRQWTGDDEKESRGGRRSARIGAVGRQRSLAVARAGGGQRLKTAGGGRRTQ